MSYPKKNVATTKAKNTTPVKSPTDPKREKLLAIQEREQLKGLLATKFLEKYSAGKQADKDYVNKEVTEFLKNEKVTEESLKKLEQRIKDGSKPKNAQGKPDTASQARQQDQHSVAGTQSNIVVHQQQSRQYDDDAVSVASSTKPKSVYAQGDSDDEWATMLKYDTDLYKREKELEKARELEQKRKVKEELDRQIAEKKRVKEQEEEELRRYNDLVGKQVQNFDVKEKKKEVDMKTKVMQQKNSRDKQLQDEVMRRKLDKKNEKELDSMLVKKIQEEIHNEERTAAQKRAQERDNLKQVLVENEVNKVKMAEEARREKDADVKAQQEYTRLIEKQEADRAAEVKAREDRAKRFMNMMADTVVKDQKTQIVEEERKLLQQVMTKEERDAEEDRRRLQRLNDNKADMKKYLDQQVLEKERRKQEEVELGKKQAEIWKKDTNDYNQHEKSKAEYLKDVNLKHADFLKKQIESEKSKEKKINTQELLLNKPKLKEIAVQNGGEQHFQKQLVNGRY